MEERLFWIGLTMGGYAWATRYGTKSGKLDSRAATAFWHSLFCAIAGFALFLVIMLSVESRVRSIALAPGLISARELFPSAIAALLAGAGGFWWAWTKGAKPEKRKGFLGEDLEWAETVFSAVLLAAVLMYFVVQAFKIPSGSMESTLRIGDHLFVNKFIYGVRIPYTDKRVFRLRPVKRGDIIVFMFPSDAPEEAHCGSFQYGKDFIKRVIGLPGETVEVRRGVVFINGQQLTGEKYAQYLDSSRNPSPVHSMSEQEYQAAWEDRTLDYKLIDGMRDTFGPVVVPPKSYFVMGDNRDRSCDGRFWGPVQERYLKGWAWVIYWPPSRMGRIS